MNGWDCRGLTFCYPSAPAPAVRDVTLRVPAGSCTAVIGPNGSGKSSLLRLLLGTLSPQAGVAQFGGRAAAEWERPAMARAVGVVSQHEETTFPISVRELVALGRYPHLGAWRREGPSDRDAVREAMQRCDVAGLGDREVSTLSGGERQRARIARALAQQPGALALDEPTAALDIAHEMAIWELLRGLVGEGVTVLLVTHNLNLAARYADQLVLLGDGRVAAQGQPADVLTREHVERVYGWPVQIAVHAGAPQVIPLGRAHAA